MEIIKPSWEILDEPNWDETLLKLERAMRTCYKSEDKITKGSADKLIRSIIKRGHESTLEHQSMTVKFICDRGISHEFVRHRHCSFSQESTRYVNYGKTKDIKFILPCWMDDKWVGLWDENMLDAISISPINMNKHNAELEWMDAMYDSECSYNELVNNQEWTPEQARSVLPNSLKTEIVVTTNIRDWRHIFHLRCDKTAHPQMRELMLPLYDYLVGVCPTLFDSVQFNR